MAETVRTSGEMNALSRSAEDLWSKAVEALDDEDRICINFQEDVDGGAHSGDLLSSDRLAILKDVLRNVDEKKRICMEKRWKYKKGTKTIIIRDQLEKVTDWVNKFKQIGDIAVQYDPAHAALPWTGVRFFLQVTVNDSQTFGAMVDGLEMITDLLTRYTIFEHLYLQEAMIGQIENSLKEQLTQAITRLYISILKYLSNARQYYDRRTAARLAKSIVKNAESTVGLYIESILTEKANVDECARLVDAAYRQRISTITSAYQTSILEKLQKLGDLLGTIDEPIRRSATKISEIHDTLQRQERQAMFNWLSRTQHKQYHKTIGKDFLQQSGQWLMEHPSFAEWRSDSCSSILWLHGIPGSGKTKLVYAVIEFLNERSSSVTASAPLAFFYCVRNASEPERADPDEILRSILKQLSCTRSDMPVRGPMATRYKNLKDEADEDGCEDPPKLNVKECVEIILELLDENPAIIIIDALDECDPNRRHEIITALQTIIQSAASVVKVFVSSRDDQDIRCRLENSPNIYIQARKNGEDIQRFIETQVYQAVRERRLLSGNVSGELQNHITNTLISKAQGMFRWASLQIQNLCDAQRIKHEQDIREELGKLPRDLKQSYDAIYSRIISAGSTSRAVAEKAMKWILCAQRRLNMEELIAAVSTDLHGHHITLTAIDLLNMCCNLLIIDEEAKIFRFAHLSVREYLESRDGYDELEINTLVLERCLDACLSRTSETYNTKDDLHMELGPYAVLYWPSHCETLGNLHVPHSIQDKVKRLLFESEGHSYFTKWAMDVKAFWDETYTLDLKALSASVSPVALASCYGLFWILLFMEEAGVMQKALLDSKLPSRVDQLTVDRPYADDRPGRSPLSYATQYGHFDVVKFLLAQDNVDANGKGDDIFQPPLSLAAGRGYANIVSLLLDADGIEINYYGIEYRVAPLLEAARNGHSEVVSLLLRKPGIEVNPKDERGRTPLALTASEGHWSTFNLLLEETGVDLNPRDFDGESPIYLAASHKHWNIVKALLKTQRVDTETRAASRQTLLLLAATDSHWEVVELLLEREDTDINSKDSNSRTALALAAREGHLETVKRILQHPNVEINTADIGGYTPLIAAAQSGNPMVVKLFLDKGGLEVNYKDKDDHTALWWAKKFYYMEVVRLLCQVNGIELPWRDVATQTPESTRTISRAEAAAMYDPSLSIESNSSTQTELEISQALLVSTLRS